MCPGCGGDFNILEDDVLCSKCVAIEKTSNDLERTKIEEKPQCPTCGLIFIQLKVICPSCVKDYRKRDSVPTSVLEIEGVSAVLYGADKATANGGLVQDILARASDYQQSASTRRLAVRPKNDNLLKAGNASKSSEYLQDRRVAKTLGGGGRVRLGLEVNPNIKIQATIWGGDWGKFKQVGTRFAETFEPAAPTRAAIESLFLVVQTMHHSLFPNAKMLTWETILLHSAETSAAKNCTHLAFDLDNKTVNELFTHFRTNKLAMDADLKKLTINLRFMYLDTVVIDHEYDDHASAMAPPPSKRAKTSQIQSSKPRTVRASAYRPPIGAVPQVQWTRNPPLVERSFTWQTISCHPDVSLKVISSGMLETILVGADFVHGEGLAKRKDLEHYQTSCMGNGHTKRGIYGRFGDIEYVLTQVRDPDNTSNHFLLLAELGLLAQGDHFKTLFDEYAADMDIAPPKFKFNFEGAFVGVIDGIHQTDTLLPHTTFLATPLLPTGPLRVGIKKFTGNDGPGEPRSTMDLAVHAFVHYVQKMTGGDILFCDLQGIIDKDGITKLIDPQCHTASRVPGVDVPYWNTGVRGIEAFNKEHQLVCANNWVCNDLEIESMEVV